MLSIYISFSAFISYLQAFKYETIFVAGDLNINLLAPEGDSNNNCFDLRDTYNLSNVMKSPTCLSQSKVHFHALLIKKSSSFRKTFVSETVIFGTHKLVATIFRSTFVNPLVPGVH